MSHHFFWYAGFLSYSPFGPCPRNNSICKQYLLSLQKRKIAWGDAGQAADVSEIVSLQNPSTVDETAVSSMQVSTADCINNMDINKRDSTNGEVELFEEDKKVSGLLFIKIFMKSDQKQLKLLC